VPIDYSIGATVVPVLVPIDYIAGQLSRPWPLADPRRRGKSSARPDADGLRLSSVLGATFVPDRGGRTPDLVLSRLAPPRGRLRGHGRLD
jgi:hypothetical protein